MDNNGFVQLQEYPEEPQTNSIRTIEGRLLMADFKEQDMLCRIHPAVGDPVLCHFNEKQKKEVFDDIFYNVRVVGEAKEDAVTGKITSITIHEIERLEEHEKKKLDLRSQKPPVSNDFWNSPTLEELALAQNVVPIDNVEEMFGTWPGEVDDGFEELIDELRHGYRTGTGSLRRQTFVKV